MENTLLSALIIFIFQNLNNIRKNIEKTLKHE